MAVSREGGAGADVRYIDPSDNRGAGATVGNGLEGWCEDQPFRARRVVRERRGAVRVLVGSVDVQQARLAIGDGVGDGEPSRTAR